MNRFWSKVDQRGPDECWPWKAARFHFGHGAFAVSHRLQDRAHRVAWLLTNGPIPAGICVLHRCDNPACCNPAHLFLGTKTDNARDRDLKGRQASGSRHGRSGNPHQTAIGEKNGRAKISSLSVSLIRQLRADGETLASIAQMFNIGQSQISRIVRGKAWRHV